MARETTNYKALTNRCPDCGHRLSMREGSRCTVVRGDGHDKANDRPCLCRKHRR